MHNCLRHRNHLENLDPGNISRDVTKKTFEKILKDWDGFLPSFESKWGYVFKNRNGDEITPVSYNQIYRKGDINPVQKEPSNNVGFDPVEEAENCIS